MGQTDARLRGRGIETAGDPPIRDAATVIVLRDADGPCPRVLMGQRGSGAAFMPNKVVFPGGAVDPGDAGVPLQPGLALGCATRLTLSAPEGMADALAAAAIRELWEETGLALGRPGRWADAPDDWVGFAGLGLVPAAEAMRFVFRAITPPGRPRRFDARFFLVDAGALATDPDDFSRAEEELSLLQWVPLEKARGFDLPFITEVVLAEVAARMTPGHAPGGVPFFDNSGPVSRFLRLG